MKSCGLALLCLTLFQVPGADLSAKAEDADDLVHGTINIAIGNRNGLVVLTDSMLTAGDHQLDLPGQKLFRLDDHTVCAIAGFVSAPGPIPDLNESTSAIIHEYVRQSEHQPPQSLIEKTRALIFLFKAHLSLIANVRDAANMRTKADAYRFQMIIAGFDSDGRLKIARATLHTINDHGSLTSDVNEGSITEVDDNVIWKLNGMPEIADDLLRHPENASSDPIMTEYASAYKTDQGKSLSVDQLVSLAKRLAQYTSHAHPEVGGANQVAVFTKPNSLRMEQATFPVPPRPLINFSLVVNSTFSQSSVLFARGSHGVFIRCLWEGMKQNLDGQYFIGNTFRDSIIGYNGGDVNFGDGNTVVNSVLLVGPLVRPDDNKVQALLTKFHWAAVLRDFPDYAKQVK